MLQMRCCTELADVPQMLYDGGYPSAEALLSVPASMILDELNLTAAVSTSSIWDGLRWPTSSANVSLVGTPPLLASDWGEGDASGVLVDGVLVGAAVDESGCLVLPTQPCLSVLIFWVAPACSRLRTLAAAPWSAAAWLRTLLRLLRAC